MNYYLLSLVLMLTRIHLDNQDLFLKSFTGALSSGHYNGPIQKSGTDSLPMHAVYRLYPEALAKDDKPQFVRPTSPYHSLCLGISCLTEFEALCFGQEFVQVDWYRARPWKSKRESPA